MAHPVVLERLAALRSAPEQTDAILEGWLRRLAALADRGMRRPALRDCLDAADDAGLLAALERMRARAGWGDAACRRLDAELALTPAVLLDLPYDRLMELYDAAKSAGMADTASRLLAGRPGAGADETTNPHLELSAGERTAAARGGDRDQLDRLRYDRDPRVIAALLDNPRITERDVVRIAAMRPTSGAILERIAAHPRWSSRYRIRKSLAFNPATPLALARQLLPTLLRQDLAELAGSGAVPTDIRDEIEAVLRRRPRPLARRRTGESA
jgi:hypothetical protein